MYFPYFVIISPWKKSVALHIKKLESSWRMLCSKFGWNWPRGSGEGDFYNFVNVFYLFGNYPPLEKDGALHLNKYESPSPKDALCQVWLKLVWWFWRRRWKCEKFSTMTTDKTNWSEKLTWAFGSGELKRRNLEFNFEILSIKSDLSMLYM